MDRKIVWPRKTMITKYGYAVETNTAAGYMQYNVVDFKHASLPREYSPLTVYVGNSLIKAKCLIKSLEEIDNSLPTEWKKELSREAEAGWNKCEVLYKKMQR